jgi:hypothetical protein
VFSQWDNIVNIIVDVFAVAVVMQAGTLRVGDVVAAGATHGKVRTLSNAAGVTITSAGPSIAVQLIGLNAVPQAGDEFQVGVLRGCRVLLQCGVCFLGGGVFAVQLIGPNAVPQAGHEFQVCPDHWACSTLAAAARLVEQFPAL